MAGPLASLKILDFSTLLPGPFGSMMLADLGADVLRVEAPSRVDMVRAMPPFDSENSVSAWHSLLNRNKRSISLDLKVPESVEIVEQLITDGGYDIVLEQFRPGVMDRLGVGYEALSKVNPRLIYCAVTGYGQTGPYKNRAGHDNNYLALSGMMSHSGRKESGPAPLGMQVADIGGGALGAVTGILTAVIHRTVTGEGQMVDISMLDMSIAWHAHAVSHYLVGGEAPEREGWLLNGGDYYDYYETQDGRFLSVGSLEPKFWQGFCEAIERPDLIGRGFERETAPTSSRRQAVQAALKSEIRKTIASRTFDEWGIIFSGIDVCVEPVLTVPEMLAHPQVQARRMVVDVPTPNGGSQKQIGSPYKFSRCQQTYKHSGVEAGTHTKQILAGLLSE